MEPTHIQASLTLTSVFCARPLFPQDHAGPIVHVQCFPGTVQVQLRMSNCACPIAHVQCFPQDSSGPIVHGQCFPRTVHVQAQSPSHFPLHSITSLGSWPRTESHNWGQVLMCSGLFFITAGGLLLLLLVSGVLDTCMEVKILQNLTQSFKINVFCLTELRLALEIQRRCNTVPDLKGLLEG